MRANVEQIGTDVGPILPNSDEIWTNFEKDSCTISCTSTARSTGTSTSPVIGANTHTHTSTRACTSTFPPSSDQLRGGCGQSRGWLVQARGELNQIRGLRVDDCRIRFDQTRGDFDFCAPVGPSLMGKPDITTNGSSTNQDGSSRIALS